MSQNLNEGYIYIYKCIIGRGSNVCKIGVTKHFQDKYDRIKQHARTLYYGFVPYTDFATGAPIATGFKVRDYNTADEIVKEHFEKKQFAGIEIYNVDYDEAIKEIYNLLKQQNLLIQLIEDKFSTYDFLTKEKISKKELEQLKDEILIKYNNKLPDELKDMLREKDDFKENCRSHYKSGNYIDFPDDMVLDVHYNGTIRAEIKRKLSDFL